VPEFLLRKLFVPGSFKKLADGFSFQLNNTLLSVTVAGLQVSADETAVAPENLFLHFEGEGERVSKEITHEAPLPLPLASPLTLRAVLAKPDFKKLTIAATTLEMGELSFSIDLSPQRVNPLVSTAKKLVAEIRSAVQVTRIARDPQHPIYHFTPPANWMNDPNGLVSWQGQTHLFYQYNPAAPVWGPPSWGHAVSTDLVHWQRLSIAMAPTAGTPNQDGCWSGSAFMTDEGPIFVYTAVFPETVCLAKPDLTFRKLIPVGINPLIGAPPEGMTVEGFRDPISGRKGTDTISAWAAASRARGG
jgi:hypothetical protein